MSPKNRDDSGTAILYIVVPSSSWRGASGTLRYLTDRCCRRRQTEARTIYKGWPAAVVWVVLSLWVLYALLV